MDVPRYPEFDQHTKFLDWRGRPVAPDRKLGGWRGAVFIVGAGGCGMLAFGGIYFNLVLYLIQVWKESNVAAANDLTNLLGTMFTTAFVGAFVGDAYLGRLWTTVIFLGLYVVGCVLLGIAVTAHELHAGPTEPFPGLKIFVFFGLYIAALGNGSSQPLLASLGGDQFDNTRDKATFFNWFFVFNNIGELISLTVLIYFENQGRWALGFWISGAAVFVSLLLSLVGAPMARQYRAGGNPILRIIQVLVCACRKFSVRVSPDGKSLHEVDAGQASVIPGCRKLTHRKEFRWLDKAATATGEDVQSPDQARNPWRLCTVTQVEEVKCLIRIAPIVIAGVLFFTIIAQLTTLFVEQGAAMDGHLGPHFSIPAGSMQLFTVLAAAVFAPFYDYAIVPWLRKRTGHEKGMTTLQRMGWGLVLSIVAMVVAALVERKRLGIAMDTGMREAPNAIIPMSICWLIPQYVIVGMAMVFVIVGQMEFFYSELSDGMRSLGVSLPLVCRGLGNYCSTVLVTIVTDITTAGGNVGWIDPLNLNHGHIDYFYWLLTITMGATLLFYLIVAHFYTYLRVLEEDHEQIELSSNETQP